jgi:predicted tellurium resistance membrane protein TerC
MTTELIIAFFALTLMEIVLGIDNIVFIAIITGKLPANQQAKGRRLGLLLALAMRIGLLMSISWIMTLIDPILYLKSIGFSGEWLTKDVNEVSIKDLILIFGGLFLLYKSVTEIHDRVEEDEDGIPDEPEKVTFAGALVQIAMLDVIFSLDSVITAVGMINSGEEGPTEQGLGVMIGAIVVSVIVMLIFAERVSGFIERHPTVKMLALSFLMLIGVMLVAEGAGSHFDKNYIYFAMAFALLVELLNIRVRTKSREMKAIREAKAASASEGS